MIKTVYILALFLFTGVLAVHAQSSTLYFSKACLTDPSSPSPPTGSGTGCLEPTYFFEKSDNPYGTWNWDFGDGNIINNGIRNQQHTYSSPGLYNVNVKVLDNNVVLHDVSKSVNVGYYPQQPMFDNKVIADTTICDGSSITLKPYTNAPNGVTYKWFPNGETTATIDVNEPGCYTVEVIEPGSKCSRFATINVKVCYKDTPSSGGSEKWYFGDGSGMEFTMTGTIVLQDSTEENGSLHPTEEITNPIYTGQGGGTNQMNATEASAIVLDKGKQIVLYSDGKKLYSGQDDSEIKLADGSDFTLPDQAGAQGIALVPKPGCNACDFIFYYLFAVNQTTGVLSYWEIDMRDNNKRGVVTSTEGVPVGVHITGKISAERSGDDESYSISAFNSQKDEFQSVTIDSLGVHIPNLFEGFNDPTISSAGYVAVSPDGTQLAHGLVINNQNFVEIFTRDPATNTLTASRRIDLGFAAPPTVYGIAFSPNGSLLYITLRGNGVIPSKLLQLNITPGSIIEIASSLQEFGALGLGPKYGDGDKKVYLTINGLPNVHYIQAPDEVGKNEAGFTLNSTSPGIQVAGTPKLGFPNVVAPKEESEGSGTGATYSGNCLNTPTFLTIQSICDPFENEVEWTVEGKTISGSAVTHQFSKEGWHDVYISIKVNKPGTTISGITIPGPYCTTVLDTGRIYIKPAPFLDIPNPFYVCTEIGFYTIYNPEPTGGKTFTYNWMTSLDVTISRDSLFEFKLSGPYKLEIENEMGCITNYSFNTEDGCEPIVNIPNVITPNADGPPKSESFQLFYKFIERPKLEIYNRWGDRVFETDNLDNHWDGTVNGKTQDNKLFAYVLKYYSRDFLHRGEQRRVGSILVLTDK